MRVLIAFDKFKDSLSANEACTHAAAALQEAHPDWTIDLCPLADGGEGFCSILTNAAGGQVVGSTVTDPLGDPVQASLGIVPLSRIPAAARAQLAITPNPRQLVPTVAVIEMASASGLALLEPADRNPWQASTYGTGELLRTAGDLDVSGILLGVGGSATSDLGLGALAALGLQFCSAQGARIQDPIPASWQEIDALEGGVNPSLPPVRIACDVTNPLTGPQGAAAVYGPQKGLRAQDLPRLDQESARLAQLLCRHFHQPETLTERPGAGAAGGIAFGLMAAVNASLLPGYDLVAAWLDVESRLAAADLVITGEGRFDDSSLSGKGPGAIAARALALGKQVHVFAGSATVQQPPDRLKLHPITPPGVPLDQALRQASLFLRDAVRSEFRP